MRIESMKLKRGLALIAVILIVSLYAASLIFALMDSPLAQDLLMASLFCTIVLPAVLYGYGVVLRYFQKKK